MSILFDDVGTEFMDFTQSPVAGFPITIGCWANSDTVSINQAPFSYSVAASDNDLWTLIWASAALTFRRKNASQADSVAPTTLLTNTWHLVAGVQSAADSATAYVDGVPDASPSTSTVEPAGMDTVTVGRLTKTTSQFAFSGRVFWPFIYNVALTTQNMVSLFEGADPRSVRGSALKWFVDMDQTPHTAARDRMGSGNVVDTIGGTPIQDPDNPQVARLGARVRSRLARV